MSMPLSTDSAGLSQAASEFDGLASAIRQDVSNVQHAAAEVQANWRGQSGQAFQGAVANFDQKAQKLLGDLNDISTKIHESGQKYDRSNEEHAQSLSRVAMADGMGF